jgi:hydroxyacylglutathione hydrolase
VEIKHIKGKTFCIDTGMTYIPFYKIDNENIIMLDTGWADGEKEGLTNILENNSFKISGIINSHAHIDHSGNDAYFKEKYNCPIAMPASEATVCSSAINLKLYYNTLSLEEIFAHLSHMICHVDMLITPTQDSIEMCGIKFEILHTPGHSPAHICLITPDDVAYIGDALISRDVMDGAKMPYAFILAEDLKSKEKLYKLNCSQYVVAHKGIYDNITDLITDNIKFYKLRAEMIGELIVEPMTLEEIIQTIRKAFNIPIKDVYKYTLIERMLRSYIEYLSDTEIIKKAVNDGVLRYYK